jgi:methylated-DNA-[protein]-cysteine S-methyltransferase
MTTYSNDDAHRPLRFSLYDSPIGQLKLVADDGSLLAILWPKEKEGRVPLRAMVRAGSYGVLDTVARQLNEYFAGERVVFDLPMAPRGSEFQRNVWDQLAAIPYGETRSYAEIARALGNPKATRAVGQANGRNPISIVTPCHRVIAANGSLGGFAGTLEAKQYLLDLESRALTLW